MRPKGRSPGMIVGMAVLVAVVVGLVAAPRAVAARGGKGGNKRADSFTIQAGVGWDNLRYASYGSWSSTGAIVDSGTCPYPYESGYLELDGTYWQITIDWSALSSGNHGTTTFEATQLETGETLVGTVTFHAKDFTSTYLLIGYGYVTEYGRVVTFKGALSQ